MLRRTLPPDPLLPPSIIQWIDDCFNRDTVESFQTLTATFETAMSKSQRARESHVDMFSVSSKLARDFTPRIELLTGLMSSLDSSRGSIDLATLMVRHGINNSFLETLPEIVAAPLRNILLASQGEPPASWSCEVLKLVSREDLELLLKNASDGNTVSRDDAGSKIERNARHLTNTDPLPDETEECLIGKIFRGDKRWVEAQKLLDSQRVAVTEVFPKPGSTESEFLETQKSLAQLVYLRSMSMPAGQGAMNFSISRPNLTEKLNIPTFSTTCNMQPSNNSVSVDKSSYTEEKVGWAFFHAGVRVGLEISRDAPGIDTSWLILNKPNELGNRHAGLLLGLGLNGHLKKIAKWLSFKYLTTKHTMTAIGLMIGLSASYLGTMDSLVARMLSVHVTRLLPLGAAELNISPLTQTAGIIGVGLVYYNTQHRRMSDIMLSEIGHIEHEEPVSGQTSFRDESYRLAAGFSLGLMNIGKGNDLHALHDLKVVDRLLSIATGLKDIHSVRSLDQATAGATLALALIFMKTGDRSIANQIEIPWPEGEFDYVRPDILLLRAMAKSLIMWNDIRPSLGWISEKCPRKWINALPAKKENLIATDGFERLIANLPLESRKIPFYNVFTGLCWAIALKYAGSESQEALSVLQYYFEIIRPVIQNEQTQTFERELTYRTLLRFQHLLALSMATICAGTGNLTVLRILRSLHAEVDEEKTFGLHQVAHTAIGILFLGHGRYSLSTSNLAIASMLISFYPIFPKDILDNRAHLQALRHFWVFAAEPRCIVVRDFETQEPIKALVRITPRDRPQTMDASVDDRHAPKKRLTPTVTPTHSAPLTRESPCLLPELESVAQVVVEEEGYWPVTLDFENNKAHLEAFRKQQNVFLRRRPLMGRFEGSLFAAELAEVGVRADGGSVGVAGLGDDETIDDITDSLTQWLLNTPVFKSAGLDAVTAADLLPPGSSSASTLGQSARNAPGINSTSPAEDSTRPNQQQAANDASSLESIMRKSLTSTSGKDALGVKHPITTLLDSKITAVDDYLGLLCADVEGDDRAKMELLGVLFKMAGNKESSGDDASGEKERVWLRKEWVIKLRERVLQRLRSEREETLGA